MDFWRKTIYNKDYQEILNPQALPRIFETSGHWDHYQEKHVHFRDEQNELDFVLKPMNCPTPCCITKPSFEATRSCPCALPKGKFLHRNEASGAIHGISAPAISCKTMPTYF
ncbi:MAG: hypothetical protein R2857_07200 [Vampirovibrionales bacterium]